MALTNFSSTFAVSFLLFLFVGDCKVFKQLIKVLDGQHWVPVAVNKSIVETHIVLEIALPSEVLCPLYAKKVAAVNTFCFHEGLCKMLLLQPCQLPMDVNDRDEILNCYYTTDFQKYENMPEETVFHDLAGCIWLSTKAPTFTETNEKCKVGGGQIISFENFESETDMNNFLSATGYSNLERTLAGAVRNGSKNEFKWLTGTVLPTSSFLWMANEPKDYSNEVACVDLDAGKFDDVRCNNLRRAICQVKLH